VRYRLLETVRAYAVEKLVATGMEEDVRGRHRAHFIQLTECCFWQDPHAEGRWMGPFNLEHDNIRAALDWSLARGDTEACLRLVVPLSYHWTMGEHLAEAQARLVQVLALATAPDTPGRGPAVNALGFLHGITGDLDRSLALHAEAVALDRNRGDLADAGLAGWALATRLLHRGDPERAEQVLEQAYLDCRAAASPAGMGWCEFQRGWIQLAREDRPGAIRRFERALELARTGQGENLVAHALATLAPMAALDGDGERASALAAGAVEIARRCGEYTAIFMAFTRAAEVGVLTGAREMAVSALRDSLALLRDSGGRAFLADSLEFVALVRHRQGVAAATARLLGAAEGIREARRESPDVRPITADLQRCRVAVQRSLGATEFAAEGERGRRLSVAEAISYALAELSVEDASNSVRPAPVAARGSLRREADHWLVEHRDAHFELPDMKGLHYLVQLLARPGHELHVLDLVGAPDRGDAGPVLDEQAKSEFRARVRELQEEIREAEEWNDPERAARAQVELDAVTRELAAAVGLGGRDRTAASAAERARVSVRKAITAAIARIAEHDPDLGLLLSTTVRTGVFCRYTPDPRLPITWRLSG
jgi:non-specific serine/threonine protein kinase